MAAVRAQQAAFMEQMEVSNSDMDIDEPAVGGIRPSLAHEDSAPQTQ